MQENGLHLLVGYSFHKNKHTNGINLCKHFLEFIFSSGLLQDVAYGVTKIKYDSGEGQKIAHAILTTKFNHTVGMYHDSCKEMGYKPLSNSSLIRVLHAIKPSQRKCLAGLDDVTAAGMNVFAQLQNEANKFNSKSCFDALERSYLKTRYPIHCSDTDTDIASYSAKFALSDLKDKQLQSHTYLSNTT